MDRHEKLFVLGGMDAEMETISTMLGERKDCKVLNDNLGWYNASYDNLSDSTKAAINLALANGEKVYGLELRGNMEGVINIDHHKYENDDRSNTKATIEQVAEILEIALTPFQVAVALNDKGFIPAMEKAGISEDVIQQVRRLDRKCQGITSEMEAEAEICLANKAVVEDLVIINSSHSKTACYTDRLYGTYTKLLVVAPDELNFFGPTEICEELHKTFGGWSGGTAPNGFWGLSFTNSTETWISEWKTRVKILDYFNL